MHSVILLCLAANNILLMRKWNHTFLPLVICSCVKVANRLTYWRYSLKKQTHRSNDKTIFYLSLKMWILFIVVSDRNERLFVCLTIESLWDIDRDVSTAILLVFIRRWGRLLTCSYLCTLVHCDWCISILIIPTSRWCSLRGPLCSWTAVVFSDRRHPCFGNFDSVVSIEFRFRCL